MRERSNLSSIMLIYGNSLSLFIVPQILNMCDQIKKKPKFVASTKTGLRLAKAIEEMDDIDKILNPDS